MQETCSGNPAHCGAEMLMIASRLFLIKTIQKQQEEKKNKNMRKGNMYKGQEKNAQDPCSGSRKKKTII